MPTDTETDLQTATPGVAADAGQVDVRDRVDPPPAPAARARRARASAVDAVLAAAVDLAREAALDVAEDDGVGDHLSALADGDRVVTHQFDCTCRGYRGWQWAVTVARAPRSRHVTVSEVHLLPGPEAVVAPTWVPWAERIAPGDVGPGIVLPKRVDDPLLEQGFEATGDEDVDQVAIFELGLGRPRVLSREGREVAAQRWYDGSHGPRDPHAELATAQCRTCGYFVPMAGALRQVFGVCANEWSPSDGSVVSLDHGCGAHSEVDVDARPESVETMVLDELGYDNVVVRRTSAGTPDAAAEPMRVGRPAPAEATIPPGRPGEPAPDPYPDPQPFPEPAPVPQPEPVPNPMPSPVPQPGPEPLPQPGPDPTPQPGPEPLPQPGPSPTPQPGPEPLPQPGPEPLPGTVDPAGSRAGGLPVTGDDGEAASDVHRPAGFPPPEGPAGVPADVRVDVPADGSPGTPPAP